MTSTDPLGHASTYTYDALGRQSTATDATGVSQSTAYDPVGRVAVQWDTSGASWITTYDLDGNATRKADPSGYALNYTYDSLGNVKTVAVAGYTAFTNLTYDFVGRLLTTDLYPTTYTYDARGRTKTVKDGTNNTTTYDYDLANRKTAETSPLGHVKRWTYDAAGRVKATADALNNTTTYAYDAAGQLTDVTLPRGGAYAFTHDTDGHTLSQSDPLTKTTTYGYDAEGRPTSIVYPSGRSVVTAYDTAGRITSATAGGKTRTYGYDDAGRTTSAADPDTGTLQYAYNDRGLLSTVTDVFGATVYGYDVAQRLSSATPPTGTATTYAYSFNSTRETVSVRGATNADLLYNYAGRLRTRTPIAPSRTTGGSFQFDYDNAGRPINYVGGTATYDADGRVINTTDTLSGTTKTTTYGYDDADRLTSAVVTQGTTQLSSTAYQWDADSNRTSVTSGTTTTTATFNTADQLTSTSDGTSYSYDDDGRQIAVGSTAYAYNGFGELASAGGVTYGNDALGRLATRTTTAGTENFGYAGLDSTVNAWRRGSGSATHIVLDTKGGQLAFATDGAKTYRTGTNLHGDLVRLRDDFATAADWYASYDPFGAVTWTSATQPIPVPFGYQSDYTDPSTGNVDMGARNYNPGTGSFTTSDTVVGSTANTATFNRYLYANANPLTYTDPDGHMALEEKDGGSVTASKATSSKRRSSWGDYGCGIIHTSYCMDWFHKVQTSLEKDEIDWNPDDSGPSLSHDVLPKPLADLMDGATAETDKALMGTISTFRSGSLCQWGEGERCHDFDALKTKQGWTDMAKGLYEPIEDCAKHPTWEGCGRAAFSVWQIVGIIDGGTGLVKGTLKGVRGAATVEDASSVTSKVPSTGATGATEAGGATSRGLSTALAETFSEQTGLADVARKLKAEAKTPRTKVPQRRRSTSGTGSCHSFAPATLVLMANGTTKAIKDIQIGDKVLASDPDSGQSDAKAVTALHKNDDADLADVTLTDTTSDESTILHTTWHHPFWNADTGMWTEAQDLKPGTHLLDADGRTAIMVTAVKTWTGLQRMRDLTVADIHTYYVVAGGTPVLVHNCGTVDFAHGTSLKNAENIRANGLSADAARANANGGSLNRPGSFYAHQIAGPADDGVQSAYEWGMRVDPDSPASVLIGRLPKSTYNDLVDQGLVTVRPVGEGVPDETIFHPDSFPILNRDMEWLTILTP